MRFLYDTAVFVYATGGEHPYREACREIVAQAAAGVLRGEASADLVQEYAHQRWRQTHDRGAAAEAARRVAALCRLHDVRPEDVRRALDLFERSDRLGARDAVFAAIALERGIAAILSPDRDFDGIAELTRVDPADGATVAALAG